MKDEFFTLPMETEIKQNTQSTQTQNRPQNKPQTQNPQTQIQTQTRKIFKLFEIEFPSDAGVKKIQATEITIVRQLLPNVSRTYLKHEINNSDNDELTINAVADAIQWHAIMSVRNTALLWLHEHAVNTSWGWIWISPDSAEESINAFKKTLESIYIENLKKEKREPMPEVITAIKLSFPTMKVFMSVEQAKSILQSVINRENMRIKEMHARIPGLTYRQAQRVNKKIDEIQKLVEHVQKLMSELS
jgi:hypothetical protein